MPPTDPQPAQVEVLDDKLKAFPAILIVEHDPSTLELYRRVLSRDFQVLVCSDDKEALGLIQNNPLQAIILEPALHGGRGWALLAAIKETPSIQFLPVILCSTLDERKRGFEMGAVTCLVKPVLPSVLLETVHRVVTTD